MRWFVVRVERFSGPASHWGTARNTSVALLAGLCLLSLACPTRSRADVTVTYKIRAASGAAPAAKKLVLHLKGARLRIDDIDGDLTKTSVFDGSRASLAMPGQGQADGGARRALRGGRGIQIRSAGQAREIEKQLCRPYDVALSLPDTMANAKFWLVEAPDGDDPAAFWRAAANLRIPLGGRSGDVRSGAGNAGLSAVFGALAEEGGLPCEYFVEMRTADAPGGAGGWQRASFAGRITDLSTAPIDDAVFAVPAGSTGH